MPYGIYIRKVRYKVYNDIYRYIRYVGNGIIIPLTASSRRSYRAPVWNSWWASPVRLTLDVRECVRLED